MVVIDGLGCARNHSDSENWHGLASIDWSFGRLPLSRVRNLGAYTTEC